MLIEIYLNIFKNKIFSYVQRQCIMAKSGFHSIFKGKVSDLIAVKVSKPSGFASSWC